ncbi:GMC family oxidoreductase [Herbidospora galbida]|uniref:Cholesterol oxidase n=1 Tax=Herbidospora galbida TaxID=2575442 RepID=A0A4V5UYA3_9ACTN|nr:GMC family oxidoreductase [Herbidospora galbida]TKK83833.1 GMC family oxidoreductase [Herbidospora galbida]
MEHVDAVVVGSGFGGAVAAYRLAEAGLSVVVLERGRPYPPGSFPRSPAQMGRAFWDPSEGLHGMYDVWSFGSCDSIVSSGLGGGSLIYANVLLRKDEEAFVTESPLPGGGHEHWPIGRADLDPHYDEVERMLGATTYPIDRPAYRDTLKTRVIQDAAAELGLDFSLPPLAVTFAPKPGAEPGLGLPIVEPEYGSLHATGRRTCRLCGECNIGCNEGAKNSLDHNYLAAARHMGADIRTLHEVKTITPRTGGGYDIGYLRHDPLTGPHTISCDALVLAAGTYGTVKLLLSNRHALPGMSHMLGTRFSGNGDLIAFLLRAKDRPVAASKGPVITSVVRLPGSAYIQEGGFPAFVDWIAEAADVGDEFKRAVRFALERVRGLVTRDHNLSAEFARLMGRGELSDRSLPMLAMGRDVPDGILRLSGDRLVLDWTAETSDAYFDRVRGTIRRIGDVLGADYSDAPLKRVVTVHPLGGAPMGRHVGEGVVDADGQVFGHEGLYVADGAAMPGPVGANPALTIAAMADRLATRLADRMITTKKARLMGIRTVTGLSFTEEMRGSLDGSDPVSFRITITADDVDRFLAEPDHTARAEGWIDAAVCGGRRPIERGWFNLFAPGEAPDRREMRYLLHFRDGEGRPRTLAGIKHVEHGPPTRLWLDTSTLHTRLLEGHVQDDDPAKPLGSGTMHISPSDLARMLTTFKTTGPNGLAALARFGTFFLGELWDIYGPGR